MSTYFEYRINNGDNGTTKYYGDKNENDAISYLQAMGLDTNSIFSAGTVVDHAQLEQEWESLFDEPLYYSKGVQFFENDGVDEIEHLLTNTNDIHFKAHQEIDRVDVYKEMFLQSYYADDIYKAAGAAGTGLESDVAFYGDSSLLDTSYDNSLGLNILGLNRSTASPLDDAAILDLKELYDQLEEEADDLGDTLVNDSIVVGGAPELPYSSLDSEIYLLQKEMDRELNNFINYYVDFVAVYKQGFNEQAGLPEDKAVYAAQKTAAIAINYAEKYYNDMEAPPEEEFVYSQAYVDLSSIDFYTEMSQYSYDAANRIDFKNKEVNEIQIVSGTMVSSSNANQMIREAFAMGGASKEIGLEDMNEIPAYMGEYLFNSAERLVELKMQIAEKTVVASINNQVRAEYEARLGAMEAINEIVADYTGGCQYGMDGLTDGAGNVIDPYLVNINGTDYIMGRDSNDDGIINSIVEVLGVNDTKDNLFESVKKLDTDNDGYVSQEEMLAKNVIFNAVDSEGKFSGDTFSTSKIQGIDLSTFQAADGTDNVFGTFDVDLASATASARQTFEHKDYFDNLFGANVDLSVLNQEESLDVENSSEADAVAQEQETVESQELSEYDYSAFDFAFDLASDNDSSTETLLEQLCWEKGITISDVEKLNIIDSIDEAEDADIIEAKLEQKLDTLNLSA